MHVPLNPNLNNLTCCFHICLVMNREHLAVSIGEIALAYVEHLAPAPSGTAATWSISLLLLAGLGNRFSYWRHPRTR